MSSYGWHLGKTASPRKAKTAIDAARKDADGLAISDITLFELATLTSKGRVRLDISLKSFLQEVESRFVVLHRLIREIQRIALSELPH